MDPHSSSVLFCEMVVILPHPFSKITTTSQLLSDHLSSSQFSQLFSTALKVVPSLLTSAHLFSPFLCSSQLFSTTLTSAHLVLALLNWSQLFSPHATSSTLPTCSPLRSTHLTSFSAHLNFSHLLNSGQLFSTLFTSSHRASFYTEKHLHTASSYTGKLLHAEAFTHSKLLHREAFTHS